MPHYLKKRTNTRKRRLSIKNRMKAITNSKVSKFLELRKLFVDFLRTPSRPRFCAEYRLDLVKTFLNRYVINKEAFSNEFKDCQCHHIFVSSAHIFELISNEITLKRLHEYHFTRKQRQKGREAEEWAFKTILMLRRES